MSQFNKAFLFAGTAAVLTYVGLFQTVWLLLNALSETFSQIRINTISLVLHYLLTALSCVSCYQMLRKNSVSGAIYTPIVTSASLISLVHSSLFILVAAAITLSWVELLTVLILNSLSLFIVLAICSRVYERIAQH